MNEQNPSPDTPQPKDAATNESSKSLSRRQMLATSAAALAGAAFAAPAVRLPPSTPKTVATCSPHINFSLLEASRRDGHRRGARHRAGDLRWRSPPPGPTCSGMDIAAEVKPVAGVIYAAATPDELAETGKTGGKVQTVANGSA